MPHRIGALWCVSVSKKKRVGSELLNVDARNGYAGGMRAASNLKCNTLPFGKVW